ncbi:pentatricopeptide repeat-containing protein [Arabidopsis lyrata subsp. lyrata]|uniref:Pentatricopeptide repeat-containing protein n=1 Tax=Arabidopsis lyrata subsp. lyrata TaxID=81972 RepID=D7MUK4_ARALL|nr:pentatricopeptide repeat-containing protein [Arabidopsis lyrata subsp. lyrata]
MNINRNKPTRVLYHYGTSRFVQSLVQMLKHLFLQHRRTSSAYFYKFQFFTFRLFSQSPYLPNSASSLLSLSSSSSSSLAEAILKCRSAEEAFRLFETSSISRLSKTTDLQSFSAVIHVLTGAHKYTLARCLIKSLIERLRRYSEPTNISHRLFNALEDIQSPKFSIGVFSLLIMEFLEMGLFEDALWVSREMRCSPDSKACLAILNGLVRRRRFDSVWVDYQLMISRGLVPDVHIYSVLFQCCFKQGFPSKKEKLLDEMTSLGVKPNVYIYTIYIRDLCRENKMEEAEKMFELMKIHGVVPNLYTYSAMIDGYCKTGNLRQAYGLYKEILVAELLPNVVVFGTLVDGFCKARELVAARSLFVHMVKFGVDPNLYVYNCLIHGQCKSGNMLEAMGLLSEMESLNLSPDVFTYTILINGLCTEERLAEANRLFQRMKNERIFPSSVTYNSLIHGFCKEYNIEKALDLCSEMTSSGVEPNIITFSTLIDGYCKVRNIKAAMGLYFEMTIKGIVPDVVTYTTLIDAHFKEANMKEALRLYSDMLEAGIHPNDHTFACLVDGFWKEGRLSDAIDFYLENNQAATGKSIVQRSCWKYVGFTCLIEGLCQNGYILRASRFFSDMKSGGVTPDIWSYVSMLKAHLREKRITDTMMLHCDMIKTGILPNLMVNQLLAMFYQENGYLRSACFLTNSSRLGTIFKNTCNSIFLITVFHCKMYGICISSIYKTMVQNNIEEPTL